jgi:hypothetical protein
VGLDLSGIISEREFYTSHYLETALEEDLRSTFADWTIAGRSPLDALRGAAASYRTMRPELEATTTPKTRLEIQRGWLRELFSALGYQCKSDVRHLEDGTRVPILAEISTSEGLPQLWLIEAFDPTDEFGDPLALPLSGEQFEQVEGTEALEAALDVEQRSIEDVITDGVFGLEDPPRWIVLAHAGQLVLIDRTKWSQRRLLRFDLPAVFSSSDSLKVFAAIASANSVCPVGGDSLIDHLDEGSHKHAAKVSEDLKYNVREAIELLGNEAIVYLREVLKEKVYGVISAEDLSRECLRYLYRLLFLFYIEARPALGYAPMDSEEYRTGYSLESLCDLALVPLDSEESRNGFFLDRSIRKLFQLIYSGFSPKRQMTVQAAAAASAAEVAGTVSHVHTFELHPLQGDLFDEEKTPTLRRVKFRNHVLQQVLASLGYSRPGAALGRGRISYAQLGIIQLGAVYEGLLSYSGFFAEEDLYEVKKADTAEVNPLDQAWFVNKDQLAQYKEEEIVYDETGRAKVHEKGRFIYRLNGRSRQKSASYYTPEILTKSVVKYGLKELIEGKKAEDILALTICEPALGSGAFLNEAINQLADAYLEKRQTELKKRIPEQEVEQERQKVKAYLADNRVFGVDMNPIAVELAEISIWLNTIYQGHTIPWFGGQLRVGNSLIGARRQIFRRGQLTDRGRPWLDTVPERVPPGKQRPESGVYHFLVPDEGMCAYSDRVVRQMCPIEMQRISEWRRSFREVFDEPEATTLLRLSNAVDRLWDRHTDSLRNARAQTAHIFPVWGHPVRNAHEQTLSTQERDALWNKSVNPKGGSASDYQRLKFVMDYWCALWFWPIDKAGLLPSRHEFLFEVGCVLEGTMRATEAIRPTQGQMFGVEQSSFTLADEFGFVDLNALSESSERLKLVRQLASKYRFFHWELDFADVFEERGGFNLILGNPPWIKVEWNEGAVMGDFQPLYALRDVSAPELAKLRDQAIIQHVGLRSAYLSEYGDFEGFQAFLNAKQNYPLLLGSSSNTYKCFVTRAWELGCLNGVQGFLHPEGAYDDPNAGSFRAALYPRLRYHFQFQNQLMLFPVAHREKFSINVYGPPRKVEFLHMSNIFDPVTIERSMNHDGYGVCGGIKNDQNEWDFDGHASRILRISEDALTLFARLYDKPETPSREARLPVLHSVELLDVLSKFAVYRKRLRQLEGSYATTEMWHETGAVKNGTIRRETTFVTNPDNCILSGPHLNVATPLFQTPRAVCQQKGDYDLLDLTQLPADYLPRTNYVPSCDQLLYRERSPGVPWDEEDRMTNYYRFTNREMLSQGRERTLLSAILPKRVGHVHTVFTVAFRSAADLIRFTAGSLSLPVDFLVKTTGMAHANKTFIEQLPIASEDPALSVRTLMLNCVTSYYSDLWSEGWNGLFRSQRWTKTDARVSSECFGALSEQWSTNSALRTDYQRRQALLEIDVLVAMQLGLSVDELCAIYRIQFPVFRHNERNTWYDRNGRIVYLDGDQKYGLSTPDWKRKRECRTIERKINDDTIPGGPRERIIIYEAPFDTCDREADYRAAWAEFERRQS